MSTPSIKLTKILRDCSWNTTRQKLDDSRRLLFDFEVRIDGELRVIAVRHDYDTRPFYLNIPGSFESVSKPQDRYADGRPRYHASAPTQASIEKTVLLLLEEGAIPTLAEIEERKKELQAQTHRIEQEEKAAAILNAKRAAAEDLYSALKKLVDNIQGSGSINIVAAKAAIAKAERK